MSLTRDQLRAARVLLHLQQMQLSTMSKVGLSTIRRYEGGEKIGPLYLDALRRALDEAGVVFIDEGQVAGMPPGTVGVALKPEDVLPEATRARIMADEPGARAAAVAARKARVVAGDAKSPKARRENDEGPTMPGRANAGTKTGSRQAGGRDPIPSHAKRRKKGTISSA